jgi:hypothetical protein
MKKTYSLIFRWARRDLSARAISIRPSRNPEAGTEGRTCPAVADKGFIPIRLYEYFHNLLDEINNHESFGLTQEIFFDWSAAPGGSKPKPDYLSLIRQGIDKLTHHTDNRFFIFP